MVTLKSPYNLKLGLLYMLLSFVLGVQAQEEEPAASAYSDIDYLWNLDQGDEAVVLADVAYIRSGANSNTTVLDSLVQGDKVSIISESAIGGSTIRGYYAPWYEIRYSKNNTVKK